MFSVRVFCFIADSSLPVACMLSTAAFLIPARSLNAWIIVYELYNRSFGWNRPWQDYKNGFGTLGSDYWFGLQKLYQLTAAAPYRIRIEVRQVPLNVTLFLQMAAFSVADESQYYKLTWSVMTGSSALTSSSPDTFHNGKTFVTYDNSRGSFCLGSNGGGWWYSTCCKICPTSVLLTSSCISGAFAVDSTSVCVNYVRMMITRV
jgi:Fibrinogen beta and gamma chains, C-terminal globular domain